MQACMHVCICMACVRTLATAADSVAVAVVVMCRSLGCCSYEHPCWLPLTHPALSRSQAHAGNAVTRTHAPTRCVAHAVVWRHYYYCDAAHTHSLRCGCDCCCCMLACTHNALAVAVVIMRSLMCCSCEHTGRATLTRVCTVPSVARRTQSWSATSGAIRTCVWPSIHSRCTLRVRLMMTLKCGWLRP